MINWNCFTEKNDDFAIYINIPFCNTACSFCHYIRNIEFKHNSVPESYLEILVRQIINILSLYKSSRKPISLYIGGGTPSLLSPEQLNTIFLTLDNYIEKFDEICIEIHPSTWNPKYIELSRISRFSIGVQSFDKERLYKWKRLPYSYLEISNIIDLIRKYVPLSIINIDLLFDVYIDEKDIVLAQSLNPDSITIYPKTGKKNPGDVSTIKQGIEKTATLLSDYTSIGQSSFLFQKSNNTISKYSIHEYRDMGDIIGFGHNSVTFLNEDAYLCTYKDGNFFYSTKFQGDRYLRTLITGIKIGVAKNKILNINSEIMNYLKPSNNDNLWYLPKCNYRSFYEYIVRTYSTELSKLFLKSVLFGDDREELIDET